MNIICIQKTVVKATGPFATIPTDPARIGLRLGGPFILGVQILTSDQLDTIFRIIVPPASLIFPDPASREQGQAGASPGDGWYRPANDSMIPVRIVVPGEGGSPHAILEMANKDASTDATVTVNLLVAAKPPDELSIELLREMRQGLDRLPLAVKDLMQEALRSVLERQGLPR